MDLHLHIPGIWHVSLKTHLKKTPNFQKANLIHAITVLTRSHKRKKF